MKKLLLLTGVMLWCTVTFAQSTPDTAYIRDHYTKMEKYITMRDGKKLFTSIYLPKDQTKKYPILMTRTPYTVSPYGANNYRKSLGQNALLEKTDYFLFTRTFAESG